MEKKSVDVMETERKKMEQRVRKGIRGIYTGTLFRLKRLVLPAVLVVCFGLLAYLSVDNALQTTGAYSVDTVTVYGQKNFEIAIKSCCRKYTKENGIAIDYETIKQQIDIKLLNSRQLLAIMERHNKSDGTDDAPAYILVNEKNEFVRAYDSGLDFDELIQELFDLGYLEES